MECVLLRLLRSPRRHYAERRGEKERRTDNHLQRERQSKIERRWRRRRPLPPSPFLFLPRAFFLLLFMDPKGGRGKRENGAPSFFLLPTLTQFPSHPFYFLVPKGPASLSQTRAAPFFLPPRAREKKYSNLPHVSFSQAREKYVLGEVTFSLTLFGINVGIGQNWASPLTSLNIWGILCPSFGEGKKRRSLVVHKKIMRLSSQFLGRTMISSLSLPRKSTGRKGNQDIAKDQTC